MRFKKQICLLLVALISVLLLISCGDDGKVAYPIPETEAKDTVQTEPPRETTDDGTFTHVIKNGKKYYRVIYPADAGRELTEAAESLKSAVSALTGEELVVRSDVMDVGDGREILIGRTNREDSKNIFGEMDFLTFRVCVTEKNIVILGSNDLMTRRGVEWFVENCIEGNFNNIGEGYWRIDSKTDHVSPAAPYILENFINAEERYFLEEKRLLNIPCNNESYILRGACSDGTYYYCAYEVGEGGDCVIYKVDLESGETVNIGKEIRGLWAVDMTFDSTRNRIVAVDYSEGRSGLSVIDPSSLTRVARYDVGESISAVAYVKETDSYLALNEERTVLLTLSSGFRLRSREDFDVSGGCGFDADTSFMYVCQSVGKTRVIRIYSHGGELINELELNGPEAAPRSLIVGDAELIFGYDTYFKGADVYEFEVKIGEKSTETE